jgi:hypothetical protein
MALMVRRFAGLVNAANAWPSGETGESAKLVKALRSRKMI